MTYLRTLLMLSTLCLSSTIYSQNNIGLRNNGTGSFPNPTAPEKWAKNQNILWKTELPASSFSSPIVVGEKIFVTCEPAWLYCLQLNSGKVLWKKSHAKKDLPKDIQGKAMTMSLDSGNTAATPISDGKQVFAIFADSVIAAYSLNGKRNWVTALGIKPGSSDGRAASPVIADGKLIVNMAGYHALDMQTGKKVWSTEDDEEAYGTAVYTEIHGSKILVTPKGSVIDLKNGKALLKELAEMIYVTPYVDKDKVYFIDEALMAYQLVKKDGKIQAKELFIEALDGSFYASPVLIDGLFYTVNDSAKLFAIEKATGKVLSQQQLKIPPASPAKNKGKIKAHEIHIYPSPITLNKNILVSNNIGDSLIVKPGKKPQVLNSNSLPQGSGGTPFIAEKKIILRSGKHICCIGKK